MIGGRFSLGLPVGPDDSLYSAQDTKTDRPVLIRVSDLKTATSFATSDRLEREAALLRGLKHPQIPTFVASGQDGARAYLAFEHVDGKALSVEMEERRYHETEVLDLIADVLPVLAYLHSLSPPVVHRDLNPSVLVRRSVDGRIILRDLSSAIGRASSRGELTTSGTLGYLAPEQFEGEAVPATDLYALGAIAVHLLSREEPERMMRERRLDWESRVICHNAFRALLRDLLAPELSDRLGDARVARTRVERVRVLVLDATKPLERREEEAATELNLPSSKFLKTRPVNVKPTERDPQAAVASEERFRVYASPGERESSRLRRRGKAIALAFILLGEAAYLFWRGAF